MARPPVRSGSGSWRPGGCSASAAAGPEQHEGEPAEDQRPGRGEHHREDRCPGEGEHFRLDRWLAEVRAQPNRLDATEYEKLTRRSTLPHPLAYAAVQPDLFGRVVSLQQPSGHSLELDKLPPRPLPMAVDKGMPHDHGTPQ